MNVSRLALFCMVLAIATNVGAQDVKQCDAALAPNIDSARSDLTIVQSYMFVNAERVYDKWQKSSADDLSTDGSWGQYGGEFKTSKSSSDFGKNVRAKLASGGYGMDASESVASYRRNVTDAQLTAWSECVQSLSNGGALILTVQSVSKSAFPVLVRWFPPNGVGTGMLHLKVENASIDGQNQITTKMEGKSQKPFIVKPNKSKGQIVLTAEIKGASDILVLPREFPKAKETITVAASDFIRPLNVALGGPPGSNYGSDVLLNGPDYTDRPNRADWEFKASAAGKYLLKVEYAAKEARPVTIRLNGHVAIENALGAPTCGWDLPCQSLLNQGNVTLRQGWNVLRVERASIFPHIHKFVFEPVVE